MICIVEPSTDHPISGGYLFNRKVAEMSGGSIRRLSCSSLSNLLSSDRQGLLLDSLWLNDASIRNWQGRPRTAWLIHSLPTHEEGLWKENLAAFPWVLVTSARMAACIRELSPKSQIQICEPGLDSYFLDTHKAWDWSGPLRLLTVGNLLPAKGYREAASFLEACASELPDWNWTIVGSEEVDPDFSQSFRREIRARAWDDRVFFRGTLDTQAGCYENADLFLFFSRQESFGMVLQEAAALGVPIVSTDVGIARELLSHEASVLLPLGEELQGQAAFLSLVKKIMNGRRAWRSRASHPLLRRSWADAASAISAGTLWD